MPIIIKDKTRTIDQIFVEKDLLLTSLEDMHALALAIELGINNYSRVVREAEKLRDESLFGAGPPERFPRVVAYTYTGRNSTTRFTNRRSRYYETTKPARCNTERASF